jgi:hypothetical protein
MAVLLWELSEAGTSGRKSGHRGGVAVLERDIGTLVLPVTPSFLPGLHEVTKSPSSVSAMMYCAITDHNNI